MNQGKALFSGILVGLFLTRLALPAHAQDDGVTRAEFLKLQNDVREQRQLIIQMLQTEQQRYDMLLRLMQGQAGMPPLAALAVPPTAEASSSESPAKRARSESDQPRRSGSIEGKVSVAGGDPGEVYVYVEGIKAPPVRNKSLEIRQEGKQFSPRVAVVQTGTSVVFPNFDTIYHNVFSNSPRNSFDLGSYRAGDKPRTVTLTTPGVVDVFCNMHQKMSASILVVPSPLFAKVKADGTYRIDNVPGGSRRVVAWGPNAKPSQLKVDVNGGRVEASFNLQHEDKGAHTNKMGQAYGSYRD